MHIHPQNVDNRPDPWKALRDIGSGTQKRPRVSRGVSEKVRTSQRQRVVIRKPIRAMPRPISRFQDCRPGIGYCMPVM